MRLMLPLGPARALRTYVIVLAVLAVTWFTWSGTVATVPHPIGAVHDGAVGEQGKSAYAVCAAHGWRPFSLPTSAARPRRVYDLIMVNDELDWLEVRLNTTFDDVDYYVIVEAPLTFTGLDKPLTIRDNWQKFAPYHAKMLYHQLQYPPNFNPPRAWDREDLQRDAMMLQVLAPGAVPTGTDPSAQVDLDTVTPQHGDVLVVADVDEIPRPDTLRALRLCEFPRRLTLASQFYYYSFQFRHRGPEWQHPQATFYDGPGNTILPVHLRNGDGGRGLSFGKGGSLVSKLFGVLSAPVTALLRSHDKAEMPNAGWHCSSCYATMAELMHKLESVSHTWMNQDYFRNPERAAHHVRLGLDLWDRESEVYDRIDGNKDLPQYLLTQPERFRYLLNRDGNSAGFSDYPSQN
ncbi:glycosyl transferase family 17 protein [Ophiostoma piceae UAMH 11346]|uniref:Glycosyl transferase family 17 protein n=1 Tax=Ophiostoma piceae (strain UAMH 11346) TaxID=1262450 RepID=S3BU26_OPHP1|nr:glycosyl transferase family 17 protein [Ophiostoma piceae UAMH 11346]